MEVITLNKEKFSIKCAELVSKIDIQPDLVVGILNGGGYLVNEIKGNFKTSNFLSIKLKRKTNLMDFFANPFFLSFLPYKILNKLRIFKSKKAEKSISSLNINDLSNFNLDFKSNESIVCGINTILIVDDAIDTGRVMFIVKNNLKKLYPNALIKSAVISWTIENSIVKPDYHLFKNVLVRFPWSKDFKQ